MRRLDHSPTGCPFGPLLTLGADDGHALQIELHQDLVLAHWTTRLDAGRALDYMLTRVGTASRTVSISGAAGRRRTYADGDPIGEDALAAQTDADLVRADDDETLLWRVVTPRRGPSSNRFAVMRRVLPSGTLSQVVGATEPVRGVSGIAGLLPPFALRATALPAGGRDSTSNVAVTLRGIVGVWQHDRTPADPS